MNFENNINALIKKYSSGFDNKIPRISIILAAGQGKRIKSFVSKALHEIWGIPSLIRVSEAAKKGISSPNQIIVVGVKSEQVLKAAGKRKNTRFVYQRHQKGTGDAVKTALSAIDKKFTGDVYIFPADAGLITEDIIKNFRKEFEKTCSDMTVLTGEYKKENAVNHYGRVIKDKKTGEVIEIKEYKDIAALEEAYKIVHKGRALAFTKDKLLKIKEFNSSIYAIKIAPLKENISSLKSANIQKEYYLTDMVKIFNKRGLKVASQTIEDSISLMGFNDRATLAIMESVARQRVYEQLKAVVSFQDPEDFFISEDAVKQILGMARKGVLVDLRIGKGAYLGKGVILGKNVKIGKNSYLNGFVTIQDNVDIADNVKIVGDKRHPVKIGKNVNIDGTSYIFGCVIESGISIEHCILVKKHIRKKGKVKTLRYIFPKEENADCLKEI